VMGNEVRKYTEAPGLAVEVEMPFSRTTAIRVPDGTTTIVPVLADGDGEADGFGEGVGASC